MRFTPSSGGGRRRRWTFGISLTVVAAAMAFVIASAFGVSGSPSNFESADGNMIRTGGATFNDWATVDGSCTASAASCTSGAFVHLADASNPSDDSFTPGQKQDTVCPDTTGHGNPNKDDFTDVASYSETQSAAPHHTFLYGATIRVAANGSASENIELKQGKNGTCANSPDLLARTLGDRMIAIDYTGGGANVAFNVLTWIESSAGFDPTPGTDPSDDIAGACFVGSDVPPCWSLTVKTLGSNAADGSTNTSVIEAADNSITGSRLVVNKFAEFGIDLVAAGIIPEGSCASFPQTVWESRSSGTSFVSSTKDISIEDKEIQNCGSVTVIKQTNPRGRNASFPFTTTLPAAAAVNDTACNGGHAAIVAGAAGQPNTFSLNDTGNAGKTAGSTNCAQNSAGNTVFDANVPQGTYTVTEGTEPSTYAFHDVTCYGGEFGANGTSSTSSKTVTIHLQPNDAVVCVYTNNLQTGALKILKNSTKSGTAVLNSGAQFCFSTTQNCSTTDVTDNGTGDSSSTVGVVCVPNVTVGTYYVNETAPPTGYGSSTDTNQSVTVAAGTNCTDNLPAAGATATLTDPPLADIQVRFRDGGSGETALDGGAAAGLTCDNTTGTSSRTDTTSWDDTLTVSGVKAGSSVVTITCTIKIDP
jgi:Prealbumin-like fold domain